MLRRTPPFKELGKLAGFLSLDLKRNAVDLETEVAYGAVSNDNSAVLSMTDFLDNKAATFTVAKTKPNYNLVDLFRHNHTTIIPLTTAPKTPVTTASDFINSTAEMTSETKVMPLNSLNNVTRVADEERPTSVLGSMIGNNLSQYEDINVIPITGRTQKLAPTG